MRVMTREVNQGVIIGENVHVTVLEIRDNVVRLGITCAGRIPRHLRLPRRNRPHRTPGEPERIPPNRSLDSRTGNRYFRIRKKFGRVNQTGGRSPVWKN